MKEVLSSRLNTDQKAGQETLDQLRWASDMCALRAVLSMAYSFGNEQPTNLTYEQIETLIEVRENDMRRARESSGQMGESFVSDNDSIFYLVKTLGLIDNPFKHPQIDIPALENVDSKTYSKGEISVDDLKTIVSTPDVQVCITMRWGAFSGHIAHIGYDPETDSFSSLSDAFSEVEDQTWVDEIIGKGEFQAHVFYKKEF